MNDVDTASKLFAGAPEGTTHLDPKDHSSSRWIRIDGAVRQYWSKGHWETPYSSKTIPYTDELIERPQEDVVWDGVGLPPVGCECEVQPQDGEPWYVVEIIAHYNGSAVFAAGDDYPHGAYDGCSRPENFRPLYMSKKRQRYELLEILSERNWNGASNGDVADAILQWMKDNNLMEK